MKGIDGTGSKGDCSRGRGRVYCLEFGFESQEFQTPPGLRFLEANRISKWEIKIQTVPTVPTENGTERTS